FAAQPDPAAAAQQPTNFNHDVFSTGGNADTARQYAQGLGGAQATPGMQRQGTMQPSGAITGHEAELILERLDTIKAEIDAIKQRMMRIERFMESADQKAGQKRYF
ncbi:hypothetical protein GOV07_02675, partial [Candidatus Woesearchaeota archaeon]|nr:hypothetical protein [Candidatus Woesearchaeota archaeon]